MRSRPLKFQNQVFWYKSKCQCWKLQPHDVTLACQFQHSNLPFTVSCIFKHIYIYCTFTVEMKEKNRLDELLFGSNSYIRMNDVSLVEILIDNFLTVCFYIYIYMYLQIRVGFISFLTNHCVNVGSGNVIFTFEKFLLLSPCSGW